MYIYCTAMPAMQDFAELFPKSEFRKNYWKFKFVGNALKLCTDEADDHYLVIWLHGNGEASFRVQYKRSVIVEERHTFEDTLNGKGKFAKLVNTLNPHSPDFKFHQ